MKKTAFALSLSLVVGSVSALAQQPLPKPAPEPLAAQPPVPSQQPTGLELMKSRGTEASLTILPIQITGASFARELRDRVSEVVGWSLEHHGLKNIELGKTDFDPGTTNSLEPLAVSLGEFVRKNPLTTDYALYAEYHADLPKHIFDGLRAIVADKTGAVIWTDHQTSQDEAFKKLEPPDLMTLSFLLVERLSPQLGLNAETTKAAKPGKMAAIMDERSGMPPENERAPLPHRQKEMKELKQQATLVVFPVRIGGNAVDTASATNLATLINDAGLFKAIAAKQSVLLKASQADPNELKALWGLAREFRDYATRNPVDADYTLYADYVFTPQKWERGIVHFVVCDRKGEWVIVDMQNSHHPDYQSIKPASREDCDKLLLKRLKGYLRWRSPTTPSVNP